MLTGQGLSITAPCSAELEGCDPALGLMPHVVAAAIWPTRNAESAVCGWAWTGVSITVTLSCHTLSSITTARAAAPAGVGCVNRPAGTWTCPCDAPGEGWGTPAAEEPAGLEGRLTPDVPALQDCYWRVQVSCLKENSVKH